MPVKGTPTHNTWHLMVQRCHNPNATSYSGYGGRGIVVCDRWRVYANFLADMGERPPGLTLGRIDNDGPYSPENCRWETWAQQNRNSRNSKLTQDEVDWMLDHATSITGKEMAQMLGIGRAQVSRVLNGKRWAMPDEHITHRRKSYGLSKGAQ